MTQKRSRWIVGSIVVAIVVTVVIAATAVLSVYLGSKISQDNFKTKQSTKSRWIIGIIIATVVVTVVIAATAVLSVYLGSKISQDNLKEAWVTFSAKVMNSTTNPVFATEREQDVTTAGKFRTIYDFQELNSTVAFDLRKHTIESTGDTVDIPTLSPRAREMCFDSDIYRAVEKVDDGMLPRRKRGCYIICGCRCNWFRCYYGCYLRCSWRK